VPSSLPEEDQKAAAVRAMFDRIAPSYDRVNRVMTGGSDQRWRRRLLGKLGVGPGDTVLDLACGTGDFSEMAIRLGAEVVGLDFSAPMLRLASARCPAADVVRADALRLPLADGCVTVVVSGFALRNFVALPPAFAEVSRVLRCRGRLGLLEVDRPGNFAVRAAHSVYFNRLVPLLGGLLSSDRHAYHYLPESAVYLPDSSELADMLREAGFEGGTKRQHMLGAVQAVTAIKR